MGDGDRRTLESSVSLLVGTEHQGDKHTYLCTLIPKHIQMHGLANTLHSTICSHTVTQSTHTHNYVPLNMYLHLYIYIHTHTQFSQLEL